ncbi:radical SAM protein [Photorhabdus akhurstii]|uniref:radical SAM protein n=1 Tax=Photorhabdus akhurstii TaxID=171438 RepID=UPI003624BB2F
MRCQHCYAWSGKKRDNELSTERIKALIDEFEALGVLQVFLTGGELFAHKDAIEIIQHARQKPFSTQIFSKNRRKPSSSARVSQKLTLIS